MKKHILLFTIPILAIAISSCDQKRLLIPKTESISISSSSAPRSLSRLIITKEGKIVRIDKNLNGYILDTSKENISSFKELILSEITKIDFNDRQVTGLGYENLIITIGSPSSELAITLGWNSKSENKPPQVASIEKHLIDFIDNCKIVSSYDSPAKQKIK